MEKQNMKPQVSTCCWLVVEAVTMQILDFCYLKYLHCLFSQRCIHILSGTDNRFLNRHTHSIYVIICVFCIPDLFLVQFGSQCFPSSMISACAPCFPTSLITLICPACFHMYLSIFLKCKIIQYTKKKALWSQK